MLVRPALSVALAAMLMLLPVHTPLVGAVMVAVGGVVSPPPEGGGDVVELETVTEMEAVAVRPALVTVRESGWLPLATAVVFQEAVAVEPVTLWLEIVVPPLWSRNVVGEPSTLLADMLTVTVPLTVAPLAGLVMAAPSGGVVGLPSTTTVTVGGLTLLSPRLSSTVSDAVYVPGVENATAPGAATVLLPGEPPGKNHWYVVTLPSGSLALPANVTDWPVWIDTGLDDGFVIVATGGWLPGFWASRMKLATDGTPFWSSTNSM